LCVGERDNPATKKRNARSKRNSKLDPVDLEFPISPHSLQLLDSHEPLVIPNTVDGVANVKIADPLRGNGIEESALEIRNTVHGEAEVEMLVPRDDNASNLSKYYQ
jgi:hypothetical protein